VHIDELIENQRYMLEKGHKLWAKNIHIREGRYTAPKDYMIFPTNCDIHEGKTLISWRKYDEKLVSNSRHLLEELRLIEPLPKEEAPKESPKEKDDKGLKLNG
jgi:hypothetical protein